MLKLSEKQKKRQEKFRNIGQALTQLEKDWRDYVGDHQFALKRFDKYFRSFTPVHDFLLGKKSEELRTQLQKELPELDCEIKSGRTEVPLGPRFNTPQFERTIRLSKKK